MSDKVSVIINFHNGEKYLKQSIKSVIEQYYNNFELILWDNCSTDNSLKIIKSFDDSRIKYFYSNNKTTLYKARNLAVKKTSGKLIAFLDCDDWWEKNYLSSRSEFFRTDNSFYYSNTNLIFKKNNKKKLYRNFRLPNGKIIDQLVRDYFIIISGVIFKKKIFEDNIFFNENYNIIGDYDFMMRVSSIYNGHSIDLPLVNYRVHSSNFSTLNSKMFYQEYKDWYYKNMSNDFFRKNIFFLEKKLKYLEIKYLLVEDRKNIKILKKILNYPDLFQIFKFLVLFFIPKKFYRFLR